MWRTEKNFTLPCTFGVSIFVIFFKDPSVCNPDEERFLVRIIVQTANPAAGRPFAFDKGNNQSLTLSLTPMAQTRDPPYPSKDPTTKLRVV